MTKAEDYIRENTRDGSNKFGSGGYDCEYVSPYYYWLTPNQARKAVEIAKEETIEKATDWLENYFKGVVGSSIYIEDFKEAMRKEE